MDAAHGAAIHEGQSSVGCLLAQLQGSCVVQGEVDKLLADGQVGAWVAVQNLQRSEIGNRVCRDWYCHCCLYRNITGKSMTMN